MSLSPTTSGQTSLIPINNCVLVRLDPTSIKETKYSTRTSGTVISIPRIKIEPVQDNKERDLTHEPNTPMIVLDLLNKRVYFEEFKEGARIKREGELFCFIKIEDIRGFEEIT